MQSDPSYAAMVESLDTNIGRLLDALVDTGHADNTLVIFTSDNGGLSSAAGSPTCNAPLAEGKGWMYDGGVRVPFLTRWPGVVTPGTRTNHPVTSPDLYPTLLSAAGAPPHPAQPADGVNLLPLLRGEPFTHGPIFWHYPHYANQGDTPAAAVRSGSYKLIRYFEDDRHELYRLDEDLSEAKDVTGDEEEITRELSTMLDEWLRTVRALIPEPNPQDAYDDLPS